MPSTPRETGFTVVELLCALAIAALLLAFGVPAMGRLLAESEVRAHSSALSVALAGARLRAVQRGASVSLCPVDGTGTCRPSADWSAGWVVFDDPQGAGRPASAAAVVEVQRAGEAGLRIASTSGRRVVTFRRDGTSAGRNVTLTVCHVAHAGVGRQVVVSNVGRARSGPLPRNWACGA